MLYPCKGSDNITRLLEPYSQTSAGMALPLGRETALEWVDDQIREFPIGDYLETLLEVRHRLEQPTIGSREYIPISLSKAPHKTVEGSLKISDSEVGIYLQDWGEIHIENKNGEALVTLRRGTRAWEVNIGKDLQTWAIQ